MYSHMNSIDENSLVTDIVVNDYRAADVLRKYQIDFCCGGRWPLKIACESRGLDITQVKKELSELSREIRVSPLIQFSEWPLDFLADYITHVHHAYLRQQLPSLKDHLESFVAGHSKKFSNLTDLETEYRRLHLVLLSQMQQEEERIFPYIRKLNRAYKNGEPYAGLLVRTLRKPIEEVMNRENIKIKNILVRIRELADQYRLPEKPCVSHRVVYSKLKELDNDLVQHLHLENDILFPRALQMEKELALKNDS